MKARGILTNMMDIMTQTDVLSCHARAIVLSTDERPALVMRPTGTRRASACCFWAERHEVTPEQFRALMFDRYRVTYDETGNWSHVQRRGGPAA